MSSHIIIRNMKSGWTVLRRTTEVIMSDDVYTLAWEETLADSLPSFEAAIAAAISIDPSYTEDDLTDEYSYYICDLVDRAND